MNEITLRSRAFGDQETIPEEFSHDAGDVSPSDPACPTRRPS